MAIKIVLRRNEPVRRALRRLKKAIEREGLKRDMMRHQYHETRGERRRRERLKNAKKGRKRT